MPIYTCTAAASTLSVDVKAELAAEVTRIHSEVNHVPSTYVNVVFNERPPTTSTPTVGPRSRC